MIKWIVIGVLILIALMDIALVIACDRWEDKETYEEYQKWKERQKDETY